MKLQTKFDEILEINESDILHFDNGLPGFEEEKQFILLPIEDTELFMLQSINQKNLAFITTNPFVFFHNYDFELGSQEQKLLGVKEENDVYVQVIITVSDPYVKSTANLQAPIIINTKNNKCKQVVLTDSRYRTKHFLTEAIIGQEG
ncbi:flagellar assembly protein FliW [Fictibacillus sp. 7GRE50]|uniref:flagellar assembly protein FliW n=1 Tax=Fictibacillus sp. 7GRE50 TaxID=2745878 RepID=UPI0018CF793B|nr:flagellar assembly protein FliW [Fictibacillus sp. 7GRE50]MBH0164050.1 flagellar assembly protein FliW [Fictibacillus sp. 7GRE50]